MHGGGGGRCAGGETSSSSTDGRVHLNVGGWRFETSLFTLRSQTDSMLARMFSDDWQHPAPNPNHHHSAASHRHGYRGGGQQCAPPETFIDRDGRHFHLVLNFLRDGPTVGLPESRDTLQELLREAEYYQLSGLKELCRQRLHIGTRLIRSGDVVRWRYDCVEPYWKSFALALAMDGIEYAFLFDRVGKKYQDRQTAAMCIGCLAKFNLDQITVFNFTVRFEEWEGLKHHMHEMRGVVQEVVGTTCCVVQWGNGKRLHLPNTAILPADQC